MKVTKVKILVSIKRFIQTGLGRGKFGGGASNKNNGNYKHLRLVKIQLTVYFYSESLPNIVKNY